MENIPGMQDSRDQNEAQIEVPDLLKFLLSRSIGKVPLLSNTIPSATDEILVINMAKQPHFSKDVIAFDSYCQFLFFNSSSSRVMLPVKFLTVTNCCC